MIRVGSERLWTTGHCGDERLTVVAGGAAGTIHRAVVRMKSMIALVSA